MEFLSECFQRAEFNTLPNPSHRVKVKVEVMQRVKGCRGHFVCKVEVSQIGPGVALARVTFASLVERPRVVRKPSLFDIQTPFGRE